MEMRNITSNAYKIVVGKSNLYVRLASVAAVTFLIAMFTVGGCGGGGGGGGGFSFKFVDITQSAGFNFTHGYTPETAITEPKLVVAGVGSGDYDGDGWVDLYVIHGNAGPNLLFRNLGNGTFEEVGASAGVDIMGSIGSGPTFADYDGDGLLDLIVGGVSGTDVVLFKNLGDGTFEDVTLSSGVIVDFRTISASFADYDRDGDLDLFLAHWANVPLDRLLWRNNGDGTFTDVTDEAGIIVDTALCAQPIPRLGCFDSFTPNFADINNDGWPDLLIAADFSSSQIFINNADGTFTRTTNDVITDENGMGAAVGDYDNDGDLDWFVTSIYDPNMFAEGNWGITGNRLYKNTGDGSFVDATDEAGVRNGWWGWGACFADFDNDGYLDIFHVNGFNVESNRSFEFLEDPSVLFMSNGDGTFTERAMELGIDDTRQGRGIVCFDFDRDGDLDIFISNNQDAPRLYRNDGANSRSWINIKLNGLPPNTQGVGARILLAANSLNQMRELSDGNNYVSNNPVEAHFGMGNAEIIDTIQIIWPDGMITDLAGVAVNQFLTVDHPLL